VFATAVSVEKRQNGHEGTALQLARQLTSSYANLFQAVLFGGNEGKYLERDRVGVMKTIFK
jgi:hypothetical protein